VLRDARRVLGARERRPRAKVGPNRRHLPLRRGPATFTLHDGQYGDGDRRAFNPLPGGRSGAATYPPRLRSTRPQVLRGPGDDPRAALRRSASQLGPRVRRGVARPHRQAALLCRRSISAAVLEKDCVALEQNRAVLEHGDAARQDLVPAVREVGAQIKGRTVW